MLDVLFIMPQKELSLKHEGNGILILATKLLQAGFQADVLRFCEIEGYLQKDKYTDFIKKIVENILEKHPKCVSFYTLYPFYHIMLRIAKELKKIDPSIYIVFGGPQASLLAEETLSIADYVDFICFGEGDNTIVPFIRTLLGGDDLSEIPGLYYRKDGQIVHNELDFPLCDVNEIPLWDKRLYPNNYPQLEPHMTSSYYYMPIDVGRGCPFNCTYCCTSLFWRRTYRLKSPERIISDIEYYIENYGIKSFLFSHDHFTADHKLVNAVCDLILSKNLNINWKCAARIDCLSEELLLKMKQAGMTEINIGIETGSQRQQQLINKRLDLIKAAEIFDILEKHNIYTILFFMYGFPEETEKELNETLALMFSLMDRGFSALIFLCAFDAKTPMTMQYLDRLVLDPNIKVLVRDAFGQKEEAEIIRQNRNIFPFYYHLDTPVRAEFQYVRLFRDLYGCFSFSIAQLRKLYAGDNLRFYRDFVANNPDLIAMDFDSMHSEILRDPLPIIYNTIRNFDQPYISQLKELLRYDLDCKRFSMSTEDVSERKTYGFSMLDFKRKLPIDRYHQAETDILLRKSGDQVSVKTLDIR